jgi:hypothetical protein
MFLFKDYEKFGIKKEKESHVKMEKKKMMKKKKRKMRGHLSLLLLSSSSSSLSPVIMSQIYELPGDGPPIAELPGHCLPAELPGDEEHMVASNRGLYTEEHMVASDKGSFSSDLLPTPFSAFSALSSHASLKPSPLNFSRPRPVESTSYNFGSSAGPIPEYETVEHGHVITKPARIDHAQEGEKKHVDAEETRSDDNDDDSDDGVMTPGADSRVYENPMLENIRRSSLDSASIGGASIDDAIPSPIKTYADLREMKTLRDSTDGASMDQAMPPSIRKLQGASMTNSPSDSIFEDFATPPGTTCPKQQYRTDSLPKDRESFDSVAPPSFARPMHPLARMDTTSSMASSFDEAAPPPVSTSRHQLSHRDIESSRGVKKGSSVMEPAFGIPSRNAARTDPRFDNSGPRVHVYKPYLDYASSIRTNETCDESEPRHVNMGAENDRRNSESSSISDFAFNGRLGWNPRRNTIPAKDNQRHQRWTAPLKLVTSRTKGKEKHQQAPSQIPQEQSAERQDSTTASGHSILSPTTSASSTKTGSSGGSSKPPIPPRIPRIIKRTSLDQMSEHVVVVAAAPSSQAENTSDRGSMSSNEWTSSEIDTSTLSVEKIHKLKKKGINPALYLEMQNARKGKSKWISPLQGNSFIS